jgi:hypothetical protein
VAASRHAWLLALLCSGCGRSEVWFPPERRPEPPEPRRCVEPGEASAVGCAFVAAAGLHLMQPMTHVVDLDPSVRDPEGVILVNPDPVRSVRVDAFHVLGDGETEPLGDTMTLAAGEQRLVELPQPEERESSGMRRQGLVWLNGDAPFVASLHMPYRPFLGNDSGLLLPEARWGRRYVVAAYAPHADHFQGVGEPTYFEIVAREDDTRVRWLAQWASTAGDGDRVPEVAAGQWSPELTLDAYEAVLVTAAALPGDDPHDRDVSGAIVEASSPVQVTAGSRCSAVPTSTLSLEGCDPLFEPLVPVEQWGQTHVVLHSPPRTSEPHHYRVLAGADGVQLRAEPPVLPSDPYVLPVAGAYLDVVVPHGTSFVLEATGPTQVMAYLQTRDDDPQLGDPSMYPIPPVEQFLTRYVVGTGVEWDTHFLQVVRPQGGADVRVDGEALGGWEPVGDYEAALWTGPEGAHAVESATPFGLVQLGWTNRTHPACLAYTVHGSCQTSYAQLGGIGTRSLRSP